MDILGQPPVDIPACAGSANVTAPTPIPIALCADDYALSAGVDDGILALAAAGRLSAVSCLAVMPRWPQAARALAGFAAHVDLGLHFALTEFAPLGPMAHLAPSGSFPSLAHLGALALAGRLDLDEIGAEFSRQYDAFLASTGRPPDFVDGHHHVHQFPGIREIVAAQLGRRAGRPWVRNTATPPGRILARAVAMPRTAVLALLGRSGRRAWRAVGLPTNADFAGVRSFREPAPYRRLFLRFIAGARPGLLVMCHPGAARDEEANSHEAATRVGEFDYLRNPQCATDLAMAGCRIVRLGEAVAR